MGNTRAILFTISTYGTWLRGDARGWVDDGIVFPPDPQLEAYDRGRMKHPAFYFDDPAVRHTVGAAIGRALIDRLELRVHALCVQRWHAHFVTGPTRGYHVAAVVKCAKDAGRWALRAGRPIWAQDFDKRFCFDDARARTRIDYVERHNLADGLPRRPWDFIEPWDPFEGIDLSV